MNEKKPISGPYRATKLWNDAVRSFYNGMPVSRHWRGLRQYDRCFTATEAVDWLHVHLQNDDNFGSSVTRDQTVKLLRKFLKSGLVEDVRGANNKPDDFKDNRELYRFSNRSPLKALRTPKTPGRSALSNINSNSSNPSETDIGASPVLRKKADTSQDDKESKLSRQESVRPRLGSVRLKKVKRGNSSQEKVGDNTINEGKEGDGMQECHLVARVLTPPETEEVWKNVLLTRLGSLCQRLLFGDSASILDASLVQGSWVHHNMTQVTSRGVVQMPQGHPDDLPNWILTAMRCLAHWPNSTESSCNIPNYPGVEKDVFKIVKEFFTNLVVPLIPSELYETLIRLYIGAEFLDITYRSPGSTVSPSTSFSQSQEGSYNTEDFSDSVEDLMLNMSITGTQKTSTPCYDELNNPNFTKAGLVSGEFRRQGSTRSTASGMQTPSLRRAAVFNTSKLQSLKLRRLKQYTDFKDTGLYPTLLEGSHENSVLQNSNENQENIRPSSRSSNKQPGSRPSSRSSSRIEYIKRRSECERERTNTSDSASSFDKSDHSRSIYSSVRNQEITTTTLPPNTCFETAFTSDSPQTRIIPQVSVDSIHLNPMNPIGPNPRGRTVKSAKRRPKSIAVAPLSESTAYHLFDTTREIKNLSSMSDLFKSSLGSSCGSDDYMSASLQSPLNKSRSTGNLHAIDVENAEGISLCSSFNTQPRGSFLAARVRDSIKRKHIRDESQQRKRSNSGRGPFSIDNSLDDDSRNINRLRTKSGGYMNLGLSSFEAGLDDARSIKSEYHLNKKSDYEDLGGLEHMRTKSGGFLNLALAPSSDSVDCSDNTMDSADTFSCGPPTSRSDSAVIDSQRLIRRQNLSAGAAPNTDKIRRKMSVGNGCLSHSCSSGDSIYHSAVSHCSRCVTDSPNSFQGPPLPPKTPSSSRTRPTSAASSSHDYENILNISRPLSTSANQLSDGYADRTPYGKGPPPSYTDGSLWRAFHASPRLLTREGKEIAVQCMQVVLLLLDPVRRRKLHLLLRMMSKCAGNDKLSLAAEQTTRALVLNTFSRSILLSEREADYDEMLSMRITTFLMDNHEEVFRPPQDLAVMVHRQITQLQRHQVSKTSYERQKMTGSQQFIAQLLDQIVENRQLSARSKKKQLKEFKSTYPDIYAARFPNEPVKVERPSKMRSLIKLASLSNLGKSKTLRM